MKVGFAGLGHMGAPMSRNILAAGHDLVVHDLRAAAAGLVADGAAWAASPRAAGTGREVVITMLPTPRHVEQVLLGPDGLAVDLARETGVPVEVSGGRADLPASPGSVRRQRR